MTRLSLHLSRSFVQPEHGTLFDSVLRWTSILYLLLVFAAASLLGVTIHAQTANQVTQDVNYVRVQSLPNHHPLWANAGNDAGTVPADLMFDQMTLVLSRSTQQQRAFESFLADQQNPVSPEYHHWLTPAEVGDRFGLSQQDIMAVTDWLQSQGLHINWISPSQIFIGFGGTAANVGRALQTELHQYSVNGVQRFSVSTNPTIPQALAPAVKAIHGLYTIEEHPLHHSDVMQSDSPLLTTSGGSHFITPADFATIYHLPAGVSGSGQSIGIVGRSRTNFADFANFRLRTGSSFPNPTEIVPPGSTDPGPAYTTQQGSGVDTGEQGEATLDVMRAGSVAPSANLLLVIATSSSGGIRADAQYLVQTSPVPVQVMTISFGACESAAGPSNVALWDAIFQQAAAEGISSFVSSGDSGASGCDQAFAVPPATPLANSPNYICSSSYVTCVGGTEFNDSGNPSAYWSSTSGSNLSSALGYIPEGAWNEPLDGSSAPQPASSGGGVSSVIATPSWQTGTGVPTARSGRYTPDISFSASGHDGYFGCFAANGGSCATVSGTYHFVAYSGTSASAPSMAGIAALLNQSKGVAQGNLNPQLYKLAASTPAAFHDATVASSGVASCSVTMPSMCNNSVPSATGLAGGQAGYLLTTGYDEVTGLGSLDVLNFLNDFATPPTIKILSTLPDMAFGSQIVGFSLTGQLAVQNSGSTSLNPLSISISGNNASDFTQTNDCQVVLTPASACMIQLTFKPSASGARASTLTLASTNASNSPQTVALTGTGTTTLLVPNVFVHPQPTSVTVAQSLVVTASVNSPSGGYPTPTGSVILTGGGYSSGATALNNGNASFNISAGSLTIGNDVLTVSYTPDAASSSLYSSASGVDSVTVTVVPPPSFTVSGSSVNAVRGATSGNTSTITVTPTRGFTGSVALTATVTASPAGAQFPPTLSFGSTSPVNVTSSSAGAATLTITTTAPTTAALDPSRRPGVRWPATGGAALAFILFFAIPKRRRWRTMIGMLALLAALAGGVTSCGGGGGGTGGNTGGGGTSGTTAGSYTITVRGVSNTSSSICTVSLIVQ